MFYCNIIRKVALFLSSCAMSEVEWKSSVGVWMVVGVLM